MASRYRVSSLSRLRAKGDRRAIKHHAHSRNDHDLPVDVYSVLLEALYLYPGKRSGRVNDLSVLARSPYSSRSFSRIDLIQDFLYQKTGKLYPLQQIFKHVSKLSATGERLSSHPRRVQDIADCSSDTQALPGPSITTIGSQLDALCEATAALTIDSAEESVLALAPRVSFSAPLRDRSKTITRADMPHLNQTAKDTPASSSSMSKRRFAANMPALRCQVNLPPAPPEAFFTGLLCNGVGGEVARSPGPGLFLASQSLLLPVSHNTEAIPRTPVDQVMHTPLRPPSISRPTAKKPRNPRHLLKAALSAESPDFVYTPPGQSTPFTDYPFGPLSDASADDSHGDRPVSYVVDPNETPCAPKPAARALRARPPPLFSLPKRSPDSFLTPAFAMACESPSSPTFVPPGAYELSLASPFPMDAVTSTAGRKSMLSAGLQLEAVSSPAFTPSGTPSYFAGRSYFSRK